MNRNNLLLYLITDREAAGGRNLCECVKAALDGGVTMVQLREKNMEYEELKKEAFEIKKLCHEYKVPFIINDNVRLALETDADGVHLGQSDMGIEEARRILGKNKIIGATAKTVEQAKAAMEQGADYLGSGAVFGSSTKKDAVTMSFDMLKNICRSVAIPVVAIGGINLSNVSKLAKTNMTDGYSSMVLTVVTMFIGLFVIIILAHKGVNGAVLFGMLAACVVYWVGEAIFFGTNPFASLATASFVPQFKDMADTTLFKFDFKDFISIGWFTAISLIITFCIIDMFDTIGTLVGTASRAGMVDKEGNMPNMKEALISDSVATVVGAVTGTSTVTTFVESASGVEAGGRTGLTAFTTGILFLACIFIAPLAAIIPAAATSSALIYVGILMLGGLKKVDFEDLSQVAPVALMLIAMPISGSIGHGIGLGLITYTVLKVFTGKAKEVSILTYAISLLFLVKFFLVV